MNKAALTPKIVHEEKEFAVLVKPAGLLMHALPNARAGSPTLADWILRRFPETKKIGDDPAVRPGIVHRLDKDTSGILLVCRTQAFFEYAKELFQKREVRKKYLALVRGHIDRDRGIIDRPFGIRPGTTQRSVRSSKMRKDAITEYHILARAIRSGDELSDVHFKSTFVEVFPHTGRTHQIRVHMTAIGHPILGDPLYGPKQKPAWIPRLMLHAYSLEFRMPQGERRYFVSPPDRKFTAGLMDAGVKKNEMPQE